MPITANIANLMYDYFVRKSYEQVADEDKRGAGKKCPAKSPVAK